MQKNILITGGAGFIGSNYIPYILENYDYNVVCLDKLTYAGNTENLKEVENNERYTFVQGDICDKDLVDSLFKNHKITDVIHFAAESHVDNSITGPEAFVTTNVMGTFTLIEAAKRNWMNAPFEVKSGYESCRFHHISTDEVYGALGDTGFFTETTPYAPNSPYSASKAGSDMLVRSYFHTFGMNVVTTNCSNNYGPKQHSEKLIPTIIRKALSGEPIPIYGNGKNVRDWIYVLDHCKGINKVFHEGKSGQTYNLGGKSERTNLDLAYQICSILDELKPGKDKYENQLSFVKDRAGHDYRYAIDNSKVESELGWSPEEDLESGLKRTIKSYL
ncbi:MAG: dTDP-glucose 4,6-dehydratase [Bacteriovoracaceae bacterium]